MAKILDSKSSGGVETAATEGFSLIPSEKLVAIYIAMKKGRMLQQRASALFQQGKLESDFHASSGREACAAAVSIDLQPEDTLSIAAGDWLPAFAKGLPIETLFRALAHGANGDDFSGDIETKQLNILVHSHDNDQPEVVRERAVAAHTEKKAAIVAAFLQPVPESPSRWQKVMSNAAANKLPVVFVHHVLDGPRFQPASTRSKSNTPQALFHGVPTIGVDAADPVALYRVAYEAIVRARQRRGATLLECAAIPRAVSPDSAEDANPAQPPDPVSTMETYLKRKGIQPEHLNRQVVAEFTRDIDLATGFLDH
jgi:TPP-dependent pyruvate/acetoin dehydrogenase alpha subunit